MNLNEKAETSLEAPARPFERVQQEPGSRGWRVEGEPRIAAFIWGGKTRPTPTLPYGRWKGAA